MGFFNNLKANKAYRLHANGDLEAAKVGYEEAYAEGLNDPKLLIAYAMLLLRMGDYERTIEVLRKAEKAPGVSQEQKSQIVTHFAIAISKQGRIDRAIELLRGQFQKGKTGMLYGILGFLLIEKAAGMTVNQDPPVTEADIVAAKDEALAFNKDAVEYDEDDPVCLDNFAQAYYRLLGDKEKARPLFERAYKKKPTAIDTNYFMAQYDLEQGKTDDAIAKLEVAEGGRFSPMNYATMEMVKNQLETLRK